MTPLSNVGEIQASISSAYARHGRNIEALRDVARAETRFYDLDYGIELGAIRDHLLLRTSQREAVRLVHEACREPTSLEILYYAQVGGPHVLGA